MAVSGPVLDTVHINAFTATWTGVNTAEVAGTCNAPSHVMVAGSVQVAGTFGGATVVLQGSNDGVNWVTLSDVANSAISLTAAGLVEFSSSALFMRPSASGGTGDSLTVTLVGRG